MHVERTAGSSVHAAFHRYFAERWIVISDSGELRGAAAKMFAAQSRDFYVGGHVGVHELNAFGIALAPSDLVFSIVRDPVERAVSLYFLLRRSPDWFPYMPEAHKIETFETFYDVCRERGYYFRNDHCRLLSGSEDFETTLAVIRRDFDLIGSVSNIASFERVLAEQVASRCPGFSMPAEHLNAAFHSRGTEGAWAAKSEINEVVSPALAGRLRRDNDSDTRLVEFIDGAENGLFTRSRASPTNAWPRLNADLTGE